MTDDANFDLEDIPIKTFYFQSSYIVGTITQVHHLYLGFSRWRKLHKFLCDNGPVQTVSEHRDAFLIIL